MWRWVGWGAVLGLLVVFAAGVMSFLQPPPSKVGGPEAVVAQVRLRDGSTQSATFTHSIDRWTAQITALPIGSVAHVVPRGTRQPGFFVVRADSGAFRAYSDRSPHRGQPLQLRQPLAISPTTLNGSQLGFYDRAAGALYTLDGEPFRGPGPRPLDPFPLRIDGDRVEIGTHAICPDNIYQPWCGPPNVGPRMLEGG